ncbi:hypothetical protein [Mycobacterium sp.]|uniref:hypothetical protein n=1 Tax=Mycobacterium sp. TaxID=1785 RepID=UPI002C9547D6|nr:hypothetical protein [Mycobacterium sp.]HTQ18382.1 hypothetical protein [Mycobacterium sp.]
MPAVEPVAQQRGQLGHLRANDVVTQLFCAWLAWCRFQVVVALLGTTLTSVMAVRPTCEVRPTGLRGPTGQQPAAHARRGARQINARGF